MTASRIGLKRAAVIAPTSRARTAYLQAFESPSHPIKLWTKQTHGLIIPTEKINKFTSQKFTTFLEIYKSTKSIVWSTTSTNMNSECPAELALHRFFQSLQLLEKVEEQMRSCVLTTHTHKHARIAWGAHISHFPWFSAAKQAPSSTAWGCAEARCSKERTTHRFHVITPGVKYEPICVGAA